MASSNASHISPLLKLFDPNPVINGREVDLRKIRDLIYSYAWSRNRRDEYKLDFVVTQRGVNRNVPERFIPDTPYGTSDFRCLDELPCNLHLVNKEISADFLRFIYTVNDLQIDVDLKPVHTKQAEAELQTIVNLLQNPNFHKYTRLARIRIHFPTEYPANNLPNFNQQALEDIACSLDKFQQLGYLSVRVVPTQSEPLDYELRLAAFPFYPMRMTNWSIRALNLATCKWDLVDGSQIQLLDKTWDLYQKTLTLTTPVQTLYVDKRTITVNTSITTTTNMVGCNMNGSQKRKLRKHKAAHAGSPAATNATFTNNTTASSGASTQSPHVTEPATSSSDMEPANNLDIASTETRDSEANVIRPSTIKAAVTFYGSAAEPPSPEAAVTRPPPPSPPLSPRKHGGLQGITLDSPVFNTSIDEAMITPPRSLNNENGGTITAMAYKSEGSNKLQYEQDMQGSRDLVPTPNSIALDMTSKGFNTLDNSAFKLQVDDCIDVCETKGSKISWIEKKRNSKKPKKSNANKFPGIGQDTGSADSSSVHLGSKRSPSQDDIDDQSVETMYNPSEEVKDVTPGLNDVTDSPAPFSLAEVELIPIRNNRVAYQDPNSGLLTLQSRTRQVDRHLRQQERLRVDMAKKEAEMKEAKSKRQLKKAKQLHLRRVNVASDSPLSRLMDRRNNVKKQKIRQDKTRLSSRSAQLSGGIFDSEIMQVAELFLRNTLSSQLNIGRPLLGHYFNFDLDKEDEPDVEVLDHQPQQAPSEYSFNAVQHPSNNNQNHSRLGGNEYDEEVCLSSDSPFSRSSSCSDEERAVQLQGVHNAQPDQAHNSHYINVACDEVRGQKLEVSEIPETQRENQLDLGQSQNDQSCDPPTTICVDQDMDTLDQSIIPNDDLHMRYPTTGGHDGFRRGGRGRIPRCDRTQSHQTQVANEMRNKWAIAVEAGDDALQAQQKIRQAELERRMKADGTDYSDYANPIHDNWTKTGEDGQCIDGGSEQVIYARKPQYSCDENPVTVEEGTNIP